MRLNKQGNAVPAEVRRRCTSLSVFRVGLARRLEKLHVQVESTSCHVQRIPRRVLFIADLAVAPPLSVKGIGDTIKVLPPPFACSFDAEVQGTADFATRCLLRHSRGSAIASRISVGLSPGQPPCVQRYPCK